MQSSVSMEDDNETAAAVYCAVDSVVVDGWRERSKLRLRERQQEEAE